MKITLMRHGRPTVSLSGRIAAKDLSDLAERYNAALIADRPPHSAITLINSHNLIVCSSLARSQHSAKLMGAQDDVVQIEALYREIDIPHFNDGNLILPIYVWVVVLRLLWLFGYSQNGESLKSAKSRAKKAADNLEILARKHQSVLLVGHGALNYFIVKELHTRKWRGPKKAARKHWCFTSYEK